MSLFSLCDPDIINSDDECEESSSSECVEEESSSEDEIEMDTINDEDEDESSSEEEEDEAESSESSSEESSDEEEVEYLPSKAGKRMHSRAKSIAVDPLVLTGKMTKHVTHGRIPNPTVEVGREMIEARNRARRGRAGMGGNPIQELSDILTMGQTMGVADLKSMRQNRVGPYGTSSVGYTVQDGVDVSFMPALKKKMAGVAEKDIQQVRGLMEQVHELAAKPEELDKNIETPAITEAGMRAAMRKVPPHFHNAMQKGLQSKLEMHLQTHPAVHGDAAHMTLIKIKPDGTFKIKEADKPESKSEPVFDIHSKSRMLTMRAHHAQGLMSAINATRDTIAGAGEAMYSGAKGVSDALWSGVTGQRPHHSRSAARAGEDVQLKKQLISIGVKAHRAAEYANTYSGFKLARGDAGKTFTLSLGRAVYKFKLTHGNPSLSGVIQKTV